MTARAGDTYRSHRRPRMHPSRWHAERKHIVQHQFDKATAKSLQRTLDRAKLGRWTGIGDPSSKPQRQGWWRKAVKARHAA